MEVLKLFAPYGPGWLGGAALVLIAFYFGRQFWTSTSDKTNGRASSTSSAKRESKPRWTSARSETVSDRRWKGASRRRWSAATP